MLGVLRRKAASSTLVLSQSWYTGGVSNPKALGAFLQEEPILSHPSGSQARTFSHIASTGPMYVKSSRGIKERFLPQIFTQKGVRLLCSSTGGVQEDGMCSMKDSFVESEANKGTSLGLIPNRYLVYVRKLPSNKDNPTSDEDLDKYYQSFMPTVPHSSNTNIEERSRIIFPFYKVFSGFVANLSAEDVKAVRKMPGVIHVLPYVYYL